MSDLITRSELVLAALVDESLAMPHQIERAMRCYDGLILSDLKAHVRKQFDSRLAQIAGITNQYDFTEHESMDQLSSEDLQHCWQLLKTTAEKAITDECQRLIHELDIAGSELPVSTVMEIREHRELMIPLLIQCIDRAADVLRENPDEKTGDAPFFALFLLSEFNASESITVLVKALSVPGEAPFDMFGDAIVEALASILAQLADPELSSLTPLILQRDANESIRWVAVEAHMRALAARRMSRQDVLDKLSQFLQTGIVEKDRELVTPVIYCLCDIAAHELLDQIKTAFESRLVDEHVMDLQSAIERVTSEDDAEYCLYGDQLGIADCLEELESWDAFNPGDDYITASIPLSDPTLEYFDEPPAPTVNSNRLTRTDRPGRNDPCPCGSTKKFKKCCGS